jgi:uncharacterized protein YecT (DUF1311 family)
VKRLSILFFLVFVFGICVFQPVQQSFAASEASDCDSDQLTQQDLNDCSNQDFLVADKELNVIYKKARDMIRSWDDDEGTALQAFVDGQKGWIAYRDGYCTAYAFQSHGGSMEPMLITGCMTDVTKARTKELSAMIDDSGN